MSSDTPTSLLAQATGYPPDKAAPYLPVLCLNDANQFTIGYPKRDGKWATISPQISTTIIAWWPLPNPVVCPKCGSPLQVFTDRCGNFGCWRVGCTLQLRATADNNLSSPTGERKGDSK